MMIVCIVLNIWLLSSFLTKTQDENQDHCAECLITKKSSFAVGHSIINKLGIINLV